MQVYHGSYMEIEEIDLSKAQPHRDFGQGFYVTNIVSKPKVGRKLSAANTATMVL
jgi:hypothetical protein